MKGGPKTVPEMAAATGLSVDRVLWYVIALKKYNEIQEGELAGEYFKYIFVGKSSSKEEAEE